jgi:penicillin-binding protein 1A
VLRILLFLFLLCVVAAGAGVVWLWPRCDGQDCPSVEALRDYSPPQASRVFDRNGQILAHLAPQHRIVVPLAKIPPHVAGAFLAVEDRRFFEHHGVDYRRAVGALVRDIRAMGFAQGFSTITMQLARNVFPKHLTREKTLRRKVWEIVLARQIEDAFTKDQILEMYLNQIYLGNGLYGVEAAAEGYFGEHVTQLTPAQAAMLAALPKAPTTYDPRDHPAAAIERRNLVLSLMADAGVIDAAQAAQARTEPLGLAPPPEAAGSAPYYVAEVRRELTERFGPGAETAGLRVYTSLDPELQTTARDELQKQLATVESGKMGRFRGPICSKGDVKDPSQCLQGLFVAMDAHTGDVLALVGGRDFSLSQFDRATLAKRQPGSSFKPFVYATALADSIPITTPLIGPDAADYEGDYRPADHTADSVNIDMRDGLRLSSNRAAVALGERVGVESVVRMAHELGLTTDIPAYPSTILGTASVIPIEMVSAYTAFADQGVRVKPRFIQRVLDASGKVVYEAPVQREAVLSPEVAFLTTSLMESVISHGTGWRVRESLPADVPAAGKTGTTDNSADNWFVGFTPDIAAAAWVGFDRPHEVVPGAEGGTLAAPMWGRILAQYYKSHPVPAPWQPPEDLVSAEIDHASGKLATSMCPPDLVRQEWFLPGTEPTEYCPLHPDPGVGSWFRRRLNDLHDLFKRPR